MEVAQTPERMAELARRQGLAMSWGIGSELLTPERLAVQYMDERHPVTVAAAGATPLFDPCNERLRA